MESFKKTALSVVVLICLFCAFTSAITAQDSTLSYFPLNIGNTWDYGYYSTNISDTVRINDKLYYQLNAFQGFNNPKYVYADENGRIWSYVEGEDLLWLDFTQPNNSVYQYDPNPSDSLSYICNVFVSRNVSINTLSGYYENCISFYFDIPKMHDDDYWLIFAPGVGKVHYGGAWNSGTDLVSAIINGNLITEVDQKQFIPQDYSLKQNYPNPFNNPRTTFEFHLPKSSFVTLNIYNMIGQLVKTIVSQNLVADTYKYKWDGTNTNGIRISSGVYLYKLQAGSYSAVKKMVLIK